MSYHLNGDYNLAGLTYCKAIELAPLNYEAHYNLAVLLNHLKYYKESLSEMHKANVLVMNDKGDSNQSRYIFDVMNDVTISILSTDNGRSYMRHEFDRGDDSSISGLVYINGKVVASKELDEAMYRNMQSCAALSIFRDEDKVTNEVD